MSTTYLASFQKSWGFLLCKSVFLVPKQNSCCLSFNLIFANLHSLQSYYFQSLVNQKHSNPFISSYSSFLFHHSTSTESHKFYFPPSSSPHSLHLIIEMIARSSIVKSLTLCTVTTNLNFECVDLFWFIKRQKKCLLKHKLKIIHFVVHCTFVFFQYLINVFFAIKTRPMQR